MKKLLILVPFNGCLATLLLNSPHLFISNSTLDDSFIYDGTSSPHQVVGHIISVYGPKEFIFYETDTNYVFRVWSE